MKRLTPLFLPILLLFALIACAPHGSIHDQIQGVWKVTRIVDLDEKTESDPENSHYIITRRHIMTVGGKEDRPVIDKVFADMTPEEIMSQLPAGGGFMEYQMVDGKVHRTTKFALSELFEDRLIITEIETDGSSLIFRDDHHADGHLREWHMVRVE